MSYSKYLNKDLFLYDVSHAERIGGVVLTPAQRAECYALYSNARRRENTVLSGGKILGNNDFVWKPDVVKNFGLVPGVDNSELKKVAKSRRTGFFAKHVARVAPAEMTPGAVLAGKAWSILGNDSYILGSMHGAAESSDPEDFHVCLPPDFLTNPMPYLWKEGDKYPRVTGREFIGLIHFGCQLVINKFAADNIMMQFRLVDRLQAKRAGLLEYASIVNQFSQRVVFEAHIREMIAKATTINHIVARKYRV